jgi:hypothetical protein
MPIHPGSVPLQGKLFAALLTALAVLLLPLVVESHSRWACPIPRNPDTGIKQGPCGAFDTDKMSNVSTLVIKPGPLVVQWEESIAHTGAPFRIALSSDGRDTDTSVSSSCVLLDHIPHNDKSDPTNSVESTYTLYSMTIVIPDVQCNQCSLHLVNPMTDKIGADGAPAGKGCTDPKGTCSYKCPNQNPSDWPTRWIGDNGVNVTATKRGVYRRESATWKNGYLMDVPKRYRRFSGVNGLNCTPPRQVRTLSKVAPAVAGQKSGLMARLWTFMFGLIRSSI